jgi:peptidoglycan/LPS O-acetylase OafA/YrhL
MAATTGRADMRLPELDALRGIAALLVLLHHAVQIIPRIEHPDIPGVGFLRYTLIHLTPLRVFEFGRPAVLFFFVLSGYVLTRALMQSGSPGLLAFAAQRTVRLGLPVVVSVLLSLALWWAFADPALPAFWRDHSLYTWLIPPTVGQVVSNALLLAHNDSMRLNVVLWSLVHEWRLTLLLPVVLLFRGRVALFAALVLAASWIGIMGGATENRVLLGPQLHSTFAASLYFSSGIGAGVALALWLGPDVPVLRREARLAAAIACVALFGMASDLPVYVASALLIVLARQPWPMRDWLRSRAMLVLGRISFSLYLVHVPVLVACLHQMHDRVPPALIAAFGVAAAVLAAFAFHPLVEEPARHLARRVERRLARRPGWRQATPEHRASPPAPDWAPEGGMPIVPR